MGQGNGLELLGEIERAVGEVGDGRMHATLMVQRTNEVGAAGAQLLMDEAFEERHLTVGEADGAQLRFGDGAVAVVLLHDGRQLLIVADEDEFIDVAALGCVGGRTVAGQQSDDVRFENLRGLVDDGQMEMLHVEDERVRLQRRGGGDDDAGVVQQLGH